MTEDSIIIIIIIANVLFSYKGFNDSSFYNKYMFNVSAVLNGDKLRMFSSGFLHVNITHLILNMYVLYMFAGIVISFMDKLNFLIIYSISLLFGSLLSLYFHKNEPNYSAVGASGAVTGIVYSSILLIPEMSLYLLFIPIPIPAYIFGVGYLLYSIYGMRSQNDNIGHDAHFGGALGGYITTLMLMPELFTKHLNTIAILLVPFVILIVLKRLGKL